MCINMGFSKLKIDDSGQLILSIISEQFYQRINTLAEQKYKKMNRVTRNMAEIRNERFETYDGLMIGYGLVLTTSKAALKPEIKFKSAQLIIKCRIDPERCNS